MGLVERWLEIVMISGRAGAVNGLNNQEAREEAMKNTSIIKITRRMHNKR